MEYTKIDLSHWDRGELFLFYMEHMRVVMSLTVDLHHAVADGFHLCRFFREVQALIDGLA